MEELSQVSKTEGSTEVSTFETKRIKMLLVAQLVFLVFSPLTGGFHYKVWSMLDSAFLLVSFGITAIVPVFETRQGRSLILKAAIALYLLGIIDMGINVLISGWVGWRSLSF